MQALGTSETVEVAMASVELYKDDILLVCTDGLSNKVASEEMSKTVSESESLNLACRRLVEMANERGGEDNITVIAARFDGEAFQ
jgi:protein phosphatase